MATTTIPQPAAPAAAPDARTDVFISYSRKDREFVATRLVPLLAEHGKDVWLDLEDIPPADEWRERVRTGVESANALLFVISPDSAASTVCRHELALAEEMNKRLVPVVHRDPAGAAVPEALERRNWIWLRDEDDVAAGAALVIEALETDLEWRDAHTRLAMRTHEWLVHERDGSFLLRGSDLRAAEDWLEAQTGHRETPTSDQTAYILAGRRAATRRQRTVLAGVATALVVAVVLAIVALAQRHTALDREKTARSRELAASALAVLPRDPELSVLLAAQGARIKPTAESEEALRRSLGTSYIHATLHHRGPVESASFDAAGDRVATASLDGTAAVWDVASGRQLRRVRGPGQLWGAALDPTGARLATTAADGLVELWDMASGRRIAAETGHSGNAHGPVFSPDGRVLVTEGSDGTARLWDGRTGRPLHTLAGTAGIVFNAAFDGSGRRVVTSGQDGTARVWSVASGRELVRVGFRSGWANRVAFSPDGRLIAAAGDDGTARVWDARTGAAVAVLLGHTAAVRSVAFSPDSRRVATAGNDQTAIVWDARSGRRLAIMRGDEQTVTRATFDPTGRLVATVSDDGSARLWDAATGAPVAQLLGHGDAVGGGTFSRDGRYLLTSSDDGTARLWRLPDTTGTVLRGDGTAIAGVAYSPRGNAVAAWSGNSGAWIWNAAGGRLMRRLTGGFLVRAAAFTPDGRRLVAATADTHGAPLHVWDVKSGRVVVGRPGPMLVETSISLSADGRRAATAAFGPNVADVWDTVTGRRLAELRGHRADVRSATLSPDGREVITTSLDGTVRAWAVAGARPLGVLRNGAGVLSPHAAFSPDGRWAVVTSGEGPVPVWNLHSPRPARWLRPHGVAAQEDVDVAVSRHGLVAVADRDSGGVVRIFDPRTGAVVAQLTGNRDEVRAVAFSPDGRWLATAGLDQLGRVFDVATGRMVAELRGAGGALTSVAFAGDGRHVILGSQDGTARVYDCAQCAGLPGLLREAHDFVGVGRTLTAAERRRYLH